MYSRQSDTKQKEDSRKAFYRLVKKQHPIKLMLEAKYFPIPELILGEHDGNTHMRDILEACPKKYPRQKKHKEELFHAWALQYFEKIEPAKYEMELNVPPKNQLLLIRHVNNVFFSAHCASVPGKIPVQGFFSLKLKVSSTGENPGTANF